MKRTISVISLMLCILSVSAQLSKREIFANKDISGGNYYAYPGPTQTTLTPPPSGYSPFYISHYGRHGSRFLIGKNDYANPIKILTEAENNGKLTTKGKETLRKIIEMNSEANNRLGELTLLGAEQHKEIAKRMMQRFPEVFADSAVIDAKSTIVIRCILSMENELQQMLTYNNKLRISHDASEHDMYYMNQSDEKLFAQKMPDNAKKELEKWEKKHCNPTNVMKVLFTDNDYVKKNIDANKLYYDLFHLATALQNTESRKKFSLYDIFTNDDLYTCWQYENIWWYITYGGCPLNGGNQPFTQRNLLRNIMAQADSCITLEKPGATLRFGHDTMVMPLVCLLDADGYGCQIDNLDDVNKEGWYNYRIFPMAANLQFVFYRRSPNDKDVIFKLLLNENEATLPLQTNIAPYYHWSDFREYYLEKLNSYKE